MKAMYRMIATMTTGASNAAGSKWNPTKPIHIKLIGWRPNKQCDLHNCDKLIIDAVHEGLRKWGFKNDSNCVVDKIQPYYNIHSPMHKKIYVYISQLDEEKPEPDCMDIPNG